MMVLMGMMMIRMMLMMMMTTIMRMVLEDEEDQGVATKMSGMKERKQQGRHTQERLQSCSALCTCMPFANTCKDPSLISSVYLQLLQKHATYLISSVYLQLFQGIFH